MEKSDTPAFAGIEMIYRIINRLVDLSGTPGSIPAIFGEALDFVLEISRMEVGLGYIFEGEQSCLVASSNLRPDNLPRAEQLKVKNLVPLLDRDCAAVVTREYLTATRLSLNMLFGTEIEECLAVPVSSRSCAHGVLMAMGSRGSSLTPEVEELLLLIGVTAGAAVNRLVAPGGGDFADRVTAVASLLHFGAKYLPVQKSVLEIMQFVSRSICIGLGAETCALVLVGEEYTSVFAYEGCSYTNNWIHQTVKGLKLEDAGDVKAFLSEKRIIKNGDLTDLLDLPEACSPRGFLALECKDAAALQSGAGLFSVLADELGQVILQMDRDMDYHALEKFYRSNLHNSRVLSATLSQEAICSQVACLASSLVRAKYGLFLLKDNKSGNCLLAGRSWPEDEQPLNIQGFVGVEYLFGNQPLNLARPAGDPRLPDFLREFVVTNGVCCLLLVPIRYLDSIEGMLVMAGRQADCPVPFFTIEEEKALTAYAGQAALAISNCLLRQEMEKRVVEVTTLNSITNLIFSSLNMSELLRTLVSIVARTLRTKKCWISMLDEVGMNITTVASYGLSIEDKGHLCLGLNEGIAGWVIRHEKPFICESISKAQCIPVLSRKLYREGSYLAVPIRFRGRVRGVLHVAEKILDGAFSLEDLDWLVNLTNHVSVGLENAELYENLRAVNISIIRALTAAIDAKDAYTRGHSERVSSFSVAIGEVMGLPAAVLEELQYGGWLHDVGKIGVPEHILSKPGSLEPVEYQIVCTHPVVGKNILAAVEPLANVLPLVLYHHEWYNGNGYPAGLRGESIPLGARILHVADALDAMTSNRAYRRAMAWEVALEQLRKYAGIQFDPVVVEKVIKISGVLEAKRYE